MVCHTEVSLQPFSLQLTTGSLFYKNYNSSSGGQQGPRCERVDLKEVDSLGQAFEEDKQKEDLFFFLYLTFDTYLHQPVPFSTAVTQQAEGSEPAWHYVARHTCIQQFISHLIPRMPL